jgi:hypothetical protein
VGPDGLRTFEGVEPMGRGRAKAKQVKVARQLKYNSGGTDLDRLRGELGVNQNSQDDHDPYDDDSSAYEDLADRYADYAEDHDESDGKSTTK